MAWVRLDDTMPQHPKLMAAGVQAFALDVAGLCYSNKHGTDGFIADYVLPAVLPTLSSPRKWADRLVEVGRWHKVEGGYRIHDVEDYQPSAAEQEEDRAAARERMRRLRRQRKGQGGSEDVRANIDARSEDVRDPVPSRPDVPSEHGSPQPPASRGSRASGTNPRALAKRDREAKRGMLVVGTPEYDAEQERQRAERERLAGLG